MSQTVKTLSELPVSTLEYIRLALNIAYSIDPANGKKCGEICDQVNRALELKQADYYTQFEHVTDTNPIGI